MTIYPVTTFDRYAGVLDAVWARLFAAVEPEAVDYWARHYTRLWVLCWQAEQ